MNEKEFDAKFKKYKKEAVLSLKDDFIKGIKDNHAKSVKKLNKIIPNDKNGINTFDVIKLMELYTGSSEDRLELIIDTKFKIMKKVLKKLLVDKD